MKAGHVFNLAPEPLKVEDTTFYEVGPVRLGIERRHITVESLRETYADDPKALAVFEESLAASGGEIEDGGLSVHVIDSASGHEYLRFDCFDDDPHYHYIHPTGPGEEPQNRWVRFDAAANGRMVVWVRGCLRTRLQEMLVDADAPELAARVDQVAVAAAVDAIPEIAGVGSASA